MKTLLYFFVTLQAFCLNALSADVAGDAPPREQGFEQTLIMIGIALLFFYLILWRPEQKRRKAMELQRNSLKKGDRIVAMGIVGTVVRIQENTLILRMVDGSKIEVLKAAINEVMPGTEEDAKKEEKDDKVASISHNKSDDKE
jgi:preprotein translocase subunit YajC